MDILKSFKDNCGFGLLANIKNIPSHENALSAITSLERMMHRGAVAADGKSGDGSGLLFSMPQKFMKKIALQNSITLPNQYAVAMVFMQNSNQQEIFKKICDDNDLNILFFRNVPIDLNALGEQALKSLPKITQIFITPKSVVATQRFEALLFLSRKEIEHKIDDDEFYIASMSNKVISYKGLLMPTRIKQFYKDLNDKDFEISFALFHQRFSTNTLPQWKLAQPFRTIAHNGEINSVEANRFNAFSKSENLKSEVFSDDELKRLLPITKFGGSDSSSLDNMFEFLILNGVNFFRAARVLIPAPWQNSPYMDYKLRAFYEFQSANFEAWDGPAAVSLTDGRFIGCVLDRNGLRPSKYILTNDDNIYITSEYGVLDIDESSIVERGRLQSGQMIGIDLKYGKILKSAEIDEHLKDLKPYDKWLNKHTEYVQEYVENPFTDFSEYEINNFHSKQRFFNITQELKELVIEPMAIEGKEATGSMGDDTPLVAFSQNQRNFTDFFKQKFAQVTNPPIDPIREKVVMSLNSGLGETRNILDETPSHSKRLKITSPILIKEKLDIIRSFGDDKSPKYSECFKNFTYSTIYETDLKKSLNRLIKNIEKDVRENGVRIIFLDDRTTDDNFKAMPITMVVGRVNQYLLEKKLKYLVSIITISGEFHDSHGISTAIAYGATAVYPYLLFATVYDFLKCKNVDDKLKKEYFKNVYSSLNKGVMKIMSKMGIATIASYRNSALFDVIGLSKEIANDCFTHSHSLICGLTYQDIEDRLELNYQKAREIENSGQIFPLEIGGFYKYLFNNEHHDFSPRVMQLLHIASDSGKKEDYEKFKSLVNNRGLKMVRDFFEFNSNREKISIDRVESKEKIFTRFATAAMSLGSISPEAHEAMAVAMNKIGGASNSGEGSESRLRYTDELGRLDIENIKNSNIKQIASGRFGVTPEYLRSAKEIQIKVAQGAKPGEGGQLPGHKVTPLIAQLRYTVEGVTLISPPPHHDIYSIEDLAQLIFDMKQINPKAIVTIKLVSTAGVGTIAAGVAKCYADKIIISGGDGGTGAAPLTSIKFAGNPWELGLSEAHNALKVNNLREMVHLQTDGGLKTGLDVVKAAILGAESYAFGTGALGILGCKMLRICHLNKCSVGVATQDEVLREQFVGTVERLINYFTFIAEDVREILATLGYESLEEIIGNYDLLKVIDDEFAKKFDFSQVLRKVDGINTCQTKSNEPYDKNEFEKEILKEVFTVIKNPNESIKIKRDICNLNRSFGTLTSGEIAQYYGNNGLKEGSIVYDLTGTAGQSLGAFLIKGIEIKVNGVANDYVGKGMNGGKITIIPTTQGESFSGAGNTCLYGATGGKLFVAGNVGERFAVRNSGAIAVIEGSGDHACEYMTAGVVVILGKTGINFGAGMTGGIAYLFDEKHKLMDNLNQELVVASRVDTDDTDEERHQLKKLLKEYVNETGSLKAKEILDNFRNSVRNFWMVRPKDLKKTPLNPNEGD